MNKFATFMSYNNYKIHGFLETHAIAATVIDQKLTDQIVNKPSIHLDILNHPRNVLYPSLECLISNSENNSQNN